MAPKKPGTPVKPIVLDDEMTPTIDDVVALDSVDDMLTTVVLDETEVPKMKFDEESLPRVVKVRVKKTGVTVEVSRKYFLSNQGELEIV